MPLLELPDASVYFETTGAGPPLVLIAGFASGIWSWKHQIDAFAREFTVIAFDPRGIARSSVSEFRGDAIEVQAADIAAILDFLHLEKAHVLGISFGGFVAQSFALQYPQRVDRLVLAFTSYGGKGHVAPAPEVLAAFASVDEPNSGDRIRRHLSTAFDPEFLANNADKVEEFCRLREENHVPGAVYSGQLAAATRFDHSNQASAIRAKTLVLTGDKDAVVPPQNSLNLARAIPDAELLVVPEAGHMFFVERAEEFNSAVIEFLKR